MSYGQHTIYLSIAEITQGHPVLCGIIIGIK